MELFTIEIAGSSIAVAPMFASTREYCKRYLTEKPANFRIVVTHDDLNFEQEQLEKEAREQSIRPRKFPEPFLERATILRKTAEYLLHQGTILMHGSTVAVDGAAYLFTAPCGTGKSTHTRLWREFLGNQAVMVNDDKAFISFDDGTVFACGSPWSGKHGLDTNLRLPLKGICILSRSAENMICRANWDEALVALRQQLLAYTDILARDRANSILENLAKQAPIWNLRCNMSMDAALVSYSAMSADANLR